MQGGLLYHKIQTLDQESLIDSITHYCFLIAVNEVSLPVVKSLIYSKIYEHIAERVAQLTTIIINKSTCLQGHQTGNLLFEIFSTVLMTKVTAYSKFFVDLSPFI